MDYLLAKLSDSQKSKRVILSNINIYESLPEFGDGIPYNSERKLNEDEWFCIEEFSHKDYGVMLNQEHFEHIPQNQIQQEEYSMINYIVSVQDQHNIFIFQKITKGMMLKRKMYVVANRQPTIYRENMIVINEQGDAYYFKNTDKLYFRDLFKLTSIFPGINILYREATQEEVDEFLNNDIFTMSPEFDSTKVSRTNRRKIKEAKEKYDNFTPEQKQRWFAYIREYCPHIVTADNTFEIEADKNLTLILNGINQRYFTTAINNEKKLALAVESIS